MTEEKSPPDGFVPWSRGGSPVTASWEPIYTRETPVLAEIGTFIRKPLCNSRGLLHGGVVAALCDVAMGCMLGVVLRARGLDVTLLLTTHLSVDYVGKAEHGWLRITPSVIQAGQSFGLVEATAFADDAVIAHAKASFRAMTAKTD
jgi:acyl-coenzyme A thioesterase PaaI-like protein